MRSPGVAAPTAGRAASGFRHEAFLYSSDDEFVEQTTQFILDGLTRGEAVLTVVDAPKVEEIRAALSGDADRAFFADMAQVGRNPALIIQAWRDFVDEHSTTGRAVRGIGEPISPARDEAAVVECHIHESLLNLAFGDDPDFWLLCPYDTASLPPRVIEQAVGNHPRVGAGTDHRTNAARPTDVDAGFTWPLPQPGGEVESIDFNLTTLQTLRRFVTVRAHGLGVDAVRVGELSVAVSEIATNAVVHGHGDGAARIWSEGDRVVCEVHGPGRITDPLIGRVRPPRGQMHGHGVWLANQFCDLVQIRSTEQGTTVRLHVRCD